MSKRRSRNNDSQEELEQVETNEEFFEVDEKPEEIVIDKETVLDKPKKEAEPKPSDNIVILTSLSRSTEGFRLGKELEYHLEPGQSVEIDAKYLEHPTVIRMKESNLISVRARRS